MSLGAWPFGPLGSAIVQRAWGLGSRGHRPLAQNLQHFHKISANLSIITIYITCYFAYRAYRKCNLVDELVRANENVVDILIARIGLHSFGVVKLIGRVEVGAELVKEVVQFSE